ncbi:MULTISPECIES: LPS-assembly protein LptD [unclassified Treponema]|uniref:LPS-assembly protein LptD n=1 Tax=unclassified Treponema TaxID=2638727 RepID=UPI0020A61225|nr:MULTISPECIES: LPS-assembly protein LptD [unclassified Treponema]UTC67487.1 LPS-assembly protein LptD [Treponema sp. OMZ 789]UTC70215.1 LPS-assembly protein LptD [Treponema sp. OMZ 790]UTC72930.1 LPS-assembly protein LptD [Treponema sp. OMZ 791]
MKKVLQGLIFFVFLFSANVLKAEEKSENTIKITINSAELTEYVKVPAAPITEPIDKGTEAAGAETKKDSDEAKPEKEKKDELVIFTGLVSISVADETSVSTITADKIIHNKTRETLTAIGNVVYTRKIGSDEGESFNGEALIFNIKKLEGVFVDGIIEQAPAKKGQDPFRIHTGLAGRNESGAIAFKDALLTTSKEKYPLWSIRASRLWILPGNEMAFFNGFLSVGVVPVMYFPFFYYPSDEMLFHPVFGFKNREGAFVQTTTYLLGRKPIPKSDEATSFSNFMQSDTVKKQKLEGLFFKKLDEPASDTGDSYLKLIADAYSGLGYMTGIDGKFIPKKGYVKQIDFHGLLGFSYTLYPGNGLLFSQYGDLGKEKAVNKANFFGKIVPFRYSFNFSMSMTKSPFNVSISFPFISDPFFKKDFMGRSEDMNWFKYFLNKDKIAAEESPAGEPFYSWKIDSSINPSFPVLRPWITYMSLESFSGKVNFESKENKSLTGNDSLYAPDRLFYYPKNILPELRAGLGGTIFSTSMLTQKKDKKQKQDIAGIKNPFEEKPDSTNTENDKNDKANNDEKKKDEVPVFSSELFPGYKIDGVKTERALNFIDYDLTYKLSGSFFQDLIFDHKEWKKPFDINWNNFSSNYYKLTGQAKIDSRFSYNKGFLNLSNSFELNGNHQKHTWHKDKTEQDKLQLNNYKLNVYTLNNTNSLKLNPFISNELFKPTFLEWSISEVLLQSKFKGTVAKPEWKNIGAKWDKEYIKTHAFSAGLGINIKGYTQLLSSSINLSPLLQAYSFTGGFSFPYGKLNLFTKLFEKENALKKWYWDPFDVNLSFSFPYNISLGQSYVYNIEEKRSEKYAASFSWTYMSAVYAMSYDTPYKLEPSSGWKALPYKKFIPRSFDLNFSNSSKPIEVYAWKNRIKLQFSFNSSLNFNLIRVTDSSFSFSPKLTFKIHEFLDISFSALSRNDVIARYFQDVINLPVVMPGEKNILKDLAYSFYFWDERSRLQSGFKLKSLNFDLTHYLKDWLMKFSYSIKPVLRKTGGRNRYELVPTVTFLVQWNPIGDIKVQTKKEDNVFSVTSGELK